MSVHIAHLGLEISARCRKASSDIATSAQTLRQDVNEIEREADTAAAQLVLVGGDGIDALQDALLAQQRTMSAFQHEMKAIVQQQFDLIEQLSTGCAKVEGVRNDMNQLSHEANLLAINTAVSAAQLGSRGVTVGCVARHMQDLSGEVAATSRELAERVTNLREQLPLLEQSSARLLTHTDALSAEVERIQGEFTDHADHLRSSVSDALSKTRDRATELRTDSAAAHTHIAGLDTLTPHLDQLHAIGVEAMFSGTPADLARALTGDIHEEGEAASEEEEDLDAGEMLLF